MTPFVCCSRLHAVFISLGLSFAASTAVIGQSLSLDEIIRPQERPAAMAREEEAASDEEATLDAADSAIEASTVSRLTPERPAFLPLRAVRAITDEEGSILLRGPYDAQRFLWFMPEDGLPTTLDLTLESSIYVLPERSNIQLSVNGVEAELLPADAITGRKQMSIPLPEGALRPGVNELEIAIRHTHRIRCAEDTFFEIWTRIYPAMSGARTSLPRAPSEPADLMAALAAQPRIPIQTDDAPDLSRAGLQTMLSALGRRLQGDPLSFAEARGDAATPATVRLVIDADAAEPIALRPRPSGTDLVLRPDSNVRDLAPFLGMHQSAVEGLPLINPGEAVALSAIGFNAAQISARQWENVLDFRLPEDWMVASTAKSVLRIDYAHVADLPEDARIQLEVNGRPVWRLPLDFREARIRRGVPIYIPARYLSAGRNQLRFVSYIPSETPGEACSPDNDSLLFEISGDSELTVPPSPSMHLPTLARALERVGPDDIVLADGAPASADLARATAALYPPQMVAEEGISLTLAVADGRGGSLGAARSQYAAPLQTALIRQPDQLSATPEPEPDMQTTQYSFSITGEADSAPVSNNGSLVPLPSFEGLRRAALRAESYLRNDPSAELQNWLDSKSPQAALYLSPDGREPILVAAPDASPRLVAVSVARALQEVAPLHGQVAVLDEAGAWHVWNDPTTEPRLTEALTWQNIRGVMSNYSAAYPHYYLAALTVISLVLAGSLALIMRMIHPGGRS